MYVCVVCNLLCNWSLFAVLSSFFYQLTWTLMFLMLALFLGNCSTKTVSKRGEKFSIKSAHKTDQLIALSIYVYECVCVCKIIFLLKVGTKIVLFLYLSKNDPWMELKNSVFLLASNWPSVGKGVFLKHSLFYIGRLRSCVFMCLCFSNQSLRKRKTVLSFCIILRRT